MNRESCWDSVWISSFCFWNSPNFDLMDFLDFRCKDTRAPNRMPRTLKDEEATRLNHCNALAKGSPLLEQSLYTWRRRCWIFWSPLSWKYGIVLPCFALICCFDSIFLMTLRYLDLPWHRGLRGMDLNTESLVTEAVLKKYEGSVQSPQWTTGGSKCLARSESGILESLFNILRVSSSCPFKKTISINHSSCLYSV